MLTQNLKEDTPTTTPTGKSVEENKGTGGKGERENKVGEGILEKSKSSLALASLPSTGGPRVEYYPLSPPVSILFY